VTRGKRSDQAQCQEQADRRERRKHQPPLRGQCHRCPAQQCDRLDHDPGREQPQRRRAHLGAASAPRLPCPQHQPGRCPDGDKIEHGVDPRRTEKDIEAAQHPPEAVTEPLELAEQIGEHFTRRPTSCHCDHGIHPKQVAVKLPVAEVPPARNDDSGDDHQRTLANPPDYARAAAPTASQPDRRQAQAGQRQQPQRTQLRQAREADHCA